MKLSLILKSIIFSILIGSSFNVSGQIFTKPNNSWGTITLRSSDDSTRYIPTFSGAPTSSADLHSEGPTGIGQKLLKAAILFDSTGGNLWIWNPKLHTWGAIGTGGGGGAGNPNSKIGAGHWLVDGSTNQVKTLFGINGVLIDSTTNSNALTFLLGTITGSAVWNATAIGDSYISSSANWNAKLTSVLPSANLNVGSNTNQATARAISGDWGITNLGVVTNNGLKGNPIPTLTPGHLKWTGYVFVWANDSVKISTFPGGNISVLRTSVAGDTLFNSSLKDSAEIGWTKLADSLIRGYLKNTSATPATYNLLGGQVDGKGRMQTTFEMQGSVAPFHNVVYDGLYKTQAITWHLPVRAGTTTVLGASTYNNAAGTITSTTNLVLPPIDGVTLVVGNRVMIKNQASTFQNGFYSVTQVGSVSQPWILTRGGYSSQADNMDAGASVFVQEGTVNASTNWQQITTGGITFGTTALVFQQMAGSSGGSPNTNSGAGYRWANGGNNILKTAAQSTYILIDSVTSGALTFKLDTTHIHTDNYNNAAFMAAGLNSSRVTRTQAANGFAVGDIIALSGSTYVKADTATNFPVVGVVSAIISSSIFEFTNNGPVTWTHGLTVGQMRYLTVSGGSTATAPNTTFPIFEAIDANTILVFNQRPATATVGTGGGSTNSVGRDSVLTITTGTSSTITDGYNIVRFNPSALIAAYTITLPTTWHTSNDLLMSFGGTITSGNVVVTTLTVVNGSGQTLLQASVPGTIRSGEIVRYHLSGTIDQRTN